MAHFERLPIYKRSYDLYLEQVVQKFSRYHKYTLGADLREGAWLGLLPPLRGKVGMGGGSPAPAS